MPKLLTYEHIEAMGAERIFALARELHPMIAGAQASAGESDEPSTTARICVQAVGEALASLDGGEGPDEDGEGKGESMPMVMAALFTSGLRLGYAMAFEEVEQDRALVETLTGGE